MEGYTGNLKKITEENTNYREVVYTGKHLQLVLMTLRPGEEIGVETHDTHDQFFRIEVGECIITMDGVPTVVRAGEAAIVPAGTTHNVVNSGLLDLKLYTIYGPPDHKPGTIHETKADDHGE